MDINNQDYQFYDANDDNIESQGLLGPETDYINEEPKTAQIGFIGGALAALLLLVLAVLSWILFHKNRGRVLLAHAIITTIALLIAALAAVWGLGAKSSLRTNRAPNPMMTVIVFAAGLILSAYYFLAALFLWVYRHFYRNYMYVARTNQKEWDKYFWNYEFNRAKNEDWRILLTIVIFCLIIAIVFAVIFYAAYNFIKNKAQTSKITMFVGLVVTTIFAFLLIIWAKDYQIHYDLIKSYFIHVTINLYLWALVIGIIALSLAFLNAICNLLNIRPSYFIFGAFWITFAFLLIIIFGLLFRDIARFSKNKPVDCNDAADYVHENHYKKICSSKYLDAGRTCRKEDLSIRWEATSSEIRTLNAACCQVSNDLIIWPFYILGIWGVFLLASMIVAAIANFTLTTQDPAYDDFFTRMNVMDFATIGLIVLLGIALGLYLIFRPTPLTKNRNFAGRAGFDTKADGTLVPKAAFTNVKSNEGDNLKVPNNCYRLDSVTSELKIINANTCKTNCGLSAGFYVIDGKFNVENVSGGAKQGPKSYRQFFFPEGKNVDDDFLHLFGTEAEVNSSIRSILVCHNNSIVGTSVYLNTFQVNMDNIDKNILTNGASYSYEELKINGNRPDFAN